MGGVINTLFPSHIAHIRAEALMPFCSSFSQKSPLRVLSLSPASSTLRAVRLPLGASVSLSVNRPLRILSII